jgi:hypothetical protein
MKQHLDIKLGKKPARVGAVKFKFREFLIKKKLPTVPRSFGHEKLFKNWGMLANDQVGDCVIAGGQHEVMLWNKACGKDVRFTEQSAIDDYSRIAGYVPGDPSTDQGTDMEEAAKYRRKTGLLDADGKYHQIGAYLDLEPGNLAQHLLAAYMFEAVGLGFEMPMSAMDQFNAGKHWSIVRGSRIEGGHYIPLVAHRTDLVIVTWGRAQRVTTGFFKKYNDESIVYLSEEMIQSGKSPEGFDLPALKDALNSL